MTLLPRVAVKILACIGLISMSAQTVTAADFSLSKPVRIGDGVSPFKNSCDRKSNGFTYPEHSETDPRIAVNPKNPKNIAVAFMRDPTLAISVGTTTDGGKTWAEVEPPLMSPCSIPDYNVFGDQDIDVDATGRMYLSAARANITPEVLNLMEFNFSMDGEIIVATSEDGGATWAEPVIVSKRGEYQHQSLIHAFKSKPGHAIVFWHVNTNYVPLKDAKGHLDDKIIYASTTADGGKSWSEPITVAGGEGAIDLVELPDGTLLFECICYPVGSTPAITDLRYSLTRSSDGGKTWDKPAELPIQSNTAFVPLASGEMLLAIDGQTMTVHDDGSISRIASVYNPATSENQVMVSHSTDKGSTWADPVTISSGKGPAWNAALGRTGDGSLVAMWYDSTAAEGTDFEYPAQVWAAVSEDGGKSWLAKRVSATMDVTKTPRPHGPLYFGNYFEIKATGPRSAVLAYTAVAPVPTVGLSDMHVVHVKLADKD